MAIIAASFLVLLVAAPTVYGVDHTVGGNAGWSLSGDYKTWAAGQTFTVGDNLGEFFAFPKWILSIFSEKFIVHFLYVEHLSFGSNELEFFICLFS